MTIILLPNSNDHWSIRLSRIKIDEPGVIGYARISISQTNHRRFLQTKYVFYIGLLSDCIHLSKFGGTKIAKHIWGTFGL